MLCDAASGAPGSKKRPGVRRTSRPAGGRRSLLPAHLSHHLDASNRHLRLQACSIAQRGSVLMPRQPWQRRVVACGAGAPRLGVWAAAASDELLYLGYCPGCIFRADGAVVQPRLAARQRPLLVSIPPRSAGRLQQQAKTRHVWLQHRHLRGRRLSRSVGAMSCPAGTR